MHYGIEYQGEIIRVFKTQKLAELYKSYQDYEHPEHYQIVLTKEPLTQFPQGSYYEGWEK